MFNLNKRLVLRVILSYEGMINEVNSGFLEYYFVV
ncbi:hypothetical protein SAMN05216436_10552 [bacterium A37T11]|nr:hypothetical protein SAMN05216436_10552 [bacterium A37T11]